MEKCEHKVLIRDKTKNFAYCEKCLACFKDGNWMSKEEYIKKYLEINK